MEADNAKKKIFKERLNFFIEVLLVFIGIFLLALIPLFVLPLIMDSESIYFGPIFYILRAAMICIAIPLMIFMSKAVGINGVFLVSGSNMLVALCILLVWFYKGKWKKKKLE